MSHLAPSAYLIWTIFGVALAAFYIYHLWKYDRFKCLNLTRGDNGAFKRVMTYSYLIGVPVFLVYTMGFAIIKYDEGYIALPTTGVIVKPYQLWTPQHQVAIFPLTIFCALSWLAEACEFAKVVKLQDFTELCFWLFLTNADDGSTSWFKSIYYKIWIGGTACSAVLLIAVTVSTKADPLKNEAWVQFMGSAIALLITLGFVPILWGFPNFILNVKEDGGDFPALVRLAKFHDLNILRTIFRFVFVIPVFILAVDGLQPHTHELNESMIWTDFFIMTAGFGFVVQSALTLMIFFPRNVEHETRRWLGEAPSNSWSVKFLKALKQSPQRPSGDEGIRLQTGRTYLLTDSPVASKIDLPPISERVSFYQPQPSHTLNLPEELLHKQSRPPDDAYRPGGTSILTEANLQLHTRLAPQVHPMVLNFTSPIDLSGHFQRRAG
ncbi:hypothetical protein K439DRAFT_1644356 [Ramaria rubella]|nr:hypothetical protein K439DRAFT_1644356 [Ramaria rubella]